MTIEDDRLDALRSLEILDTPPEAEFDSLVEAAATACGTPLAFLTLVDAERLWFKAGHGGHGLVEVPRTSSFCDLTVAGDGVLEVPDATLDPRFSGLDVVRAETGMRFYAGAPIRLASGHNVGAVCVFDTVPRRLEPAQRDVLRCLALAAARGFEARKALLARHRIAQSLQAAMAELDASRERLRRHYEATPAMLQSIDAEGRLVMASDLWLSKLGYAREEVIGRLATEFLAEASRHLSRSSEMPKVFREGRCDNVVCQMVARDGTLVDVLMATVLERGGGGEAMHSLTVVEDATDRLRTERALRDSEAAYRRLAEATSDVITQVDMDLVRRYVSPASRMVLGYEPEELLGLDVRGSIHPDDAEAVIARFDRLVAGTMPGDRAMVTYRKRHKSGRWIWVEAALNLVRDPGDGAPRHMICALRDVSERRRNAEELEAARMAAERAAQIKTEFLANMSHELRTPLTGLLGIHDLLAAEPDLMPRHRQHLALAQEAGRSLMAVVNDVLDFSKIEAGQLTVETVPFDLQALVIACRDSVRQQAAEKGLRLDAEAPAGLCLLGDPMRLRQVLLNLAVNAVKFTAQGRVGIEAVHDPATARLRLSVSDTGIGIPADKLAAIFERFRQADGSTSRRFGGTGLGLSICKHLVEAMGGTITVASTPGRGSVFTVELPAAAAAAAAVADASERIERTAVPRRVLLAEDNGLNRMIIGDMLTRAGHHVTAVETGAEVVARMRDPGAYDVVLMDVHTPVLDGISATRLIRNREDPDARRMPIIGLTANVTVENERSCIAAGMDAQVAKPIDWRELFATLDRLDEGRHAGLEDDAEAETPAAEPAVLDHDSLAALAHVIGPARLAEMLGRFVAEVRDRLNDLAHMPEEDLLGCAHAWISMAGHFGFADLQQQAAELHADAQAGRGLARVAALRAAAERALEAAQECRFHTAG